MKKLNSADIMSGSLLNDPRFLEQLFSQQELPNIYKEFIHPGKDPKELIMRCIFKDEREANAAILYYAKCIEFNLKEEKEIFLNWLASRVSIKGIGRRELLMATTRIVAPVLYGIAESRFRRKWLARKDEEEEKTE